jgi:probable F420-dependent oxidoreductase
MKLGMVYCNAGPMAEPDTAIALARAAEEAGVESLWTVEHVVVPKGYETPYPYSSTGKMPGGETVPITDPLVWLTFVAGVTTTVKLATGIVILPQRNPVVLAKETATLDRLSKGRLLLGVGVGWLREEFEAIGVPFERRGARTDDYIKALRALWSDDETYAGEFARFTSAISLPKPVRGVVPVIVGGHSDASAVRAGLLGDGYFPNARDLAEDTRLIELMRATAKEAGRDPADIEITVGARDVESAKPYVDLGVARITCLAPNANADDLRAQVDAWSALS